MDTTNSIGDTLEQVICGGEALPLTGYQNFTSHYPTTKIFNLYGITEITIHATFHACHQQIDKVMMSIGRPISNTTLYISKNNELLISGIGLARSYISQGRITSERFCPNAWGLNLVDNSNSRYTKRLRWINIGDYTRVYTSGDLCKYLNDGNIEYLGRIDHQVKIRGFRIEIGEIETVLNNHKSVQECIVIARKQGDDGVTETRLVAYLVMKKESVKYEIKELKDFVKSKLPEYMIPSTFVILDQFPLTPNGKIDRKALPAPDQRSDDLLSTTYVAPTTPTENILVEIWKVGIHDNFFELGGHSLLVTQLVSRIQKQLNVKVSLKFVFESPIIKTIATFIEKQQQSVHQGEEFYYVLTNILSIGRFDKSSVWKQTLPLSFGQNRLWFLDQLDPGSYAYNIPMALQFDNINSNDCQSLEEAIAAIIQRHEVLRTTFAFVDELGGPRLTITNSVSFILNIVDLKQLEIGIDDNENTNATSTVVVLGLANEDASRPFHLENGPLVRASVICYISSLLNEEDDSYYEQERVVLLFNMHHIVSDGWSMQILNRELQLFYQYFSSHKIKSIAKTNKQQQNEWLLLVHDVINDLAIQYSDFGYWQQQWLQGNVMIQHVQYWKEKLSSQNGELVSALQLPTDHPRPSVQTFDGSRTQSIQLPTSVCQGLEAVCQSADVTLFMVLLAAFEILLYQYSGGQENFAIGSPIANRNRIEIEGLIGFFVNTLVLKNDVTSNIDLKQLFNAVKNTCLEAFEHQDMPFDKLVDELNPARNLGQTPLFQVMFVLQQEQYTEQTAITQSSGLLNGINLLSTVDKVTTKFDLTLAMSSFISTTVEENRSMYVFASLEYNINIFDASTIYRMIEHLFVTSKFITTNNNNNDNNVSIKDIDALSEEEKQQLLIEWNDTECQWWPSSSTQVIIQSDDYLVPLLTPGTRNNTVHQLFQDQVNKTPDSISVVFEDEQITYRFLLC
ncbi:MAG: condensation domain-containing protein, partial [Acidimicrobiales bacterium]